MCSSEEAEKVGCIRLEAREYFLGSRMAATGHVINAFFGSSPTGHIIYALFRSAPPLGRTTIDDNQSWLHAYSLPRPRFT